MLLTDRLRYGHQGQMQQPPKDPLADLKVLYGKPKLQPFISSQAHSPRILRTWNLEFSRTPLESQQSSDHTPENSSGIDPFTRLHAQLRRLRHHAPARELFPGQFSFFSFGTAYSRLYSDHIRLPISEFRQLLLFSGGGESFSVQISAIFQSVSNAFFLLPPNIEEYPFPV